MQSRTLVRRYAGGLAQAISDDLEFEKLSGELARLVGLITGHEELKAALASPFLPVSRKNRIVEEMLATHALEEKTIRFLRLLMGHNRLNLLEEIAVELPRFWMKEKGIVAFEICSAVPLKPEQKESLERKLEALENKRVNLDFRIDPALLGGLSLKKGNIVYDVSIKGQLTRLKEKISEG